MTPRTKMIITLVKHSGQISVTPALLPYTASVYIILISVSSEKCNKGKQNRVNDANLSHSNHLFNVGTFHMMPLTTSVLSLFQIHQFLEILVIVFIRILKIM